MSLSKMTVMRKMAETRHDRPMKTVYMPMLSAVTAMAKSMVVTASTDEAMTDANRLYDLNFHK